MLEYASIRFTLGCASATTFPSVMVIAASTAKIAVQSTASGASATPTRRRMAAKAAAFGATDMNAVTGVGAPSYASGVHWWKGTTAALNARPTVTSESATTTGALRPRAAMPDEIPARSVLPVTPYSQANP